MIIIGYLFAILIGVSLGLIGSGGSILTVPLLVYIFGVNPVTATGYSLFIVGATSTVGTIAYFRKGLVDFRTAVIFGLPAVCAVYMSRSLIIPSLPDVILSIDEIIITKDLMLMLTFAFLMIFASLGMIRRTKDEPIKYNGVRNYNYLLIFVEGSVVGVLTGLVGAGGGFLIIPALVLLSGLQMHKAIGTSLIIISGKSLLGFLGERGLLDADWGLIGSITLISMIGIIVGSAVGRRVSGEKLKPFFGWFVLVVGVFIVMNEASRMG